MRPFIFPTVRGAGGKGCPDILASFQKMEPWKEKTAAWVSSDLKTQTILKISCWRTSISLFHFSRSSPSKFRASHLPWEDPVLSRGETWSQHISTYFFIYLDIPQLDTHTHTFIFYEAAVITRVTKWGQTLPAEAQAGSMPEVLRSPLQRSGQASRRVTRLPGGPRPGHRHQVTEKVTF